MMLGRSLLFLVLFAPLTIVSAFDERLHPEPSSLRRGRNVLDTCGCDDFNDYTFDTCGETEECIHTCIDDGNACTTQSLEVDGCVPQEIDVAVVCDDGNEYTFDTCDQAEGCIHTCIDDNNACTTQSLEVDSCAPQDIDVAVLCDDQNDETIDSCSPDVGCVHTCDDGNECTDDIWDETEGRCVFETKICDDDNTATLDVCLPRGGGCKFLDFSSIDLNNFEVYYENTIASLPEDTYFYEDETSLSNVQVEALLNWINKKVVLERTPFCYKQSYGRGWGEVLSTCPSHKQRIGLLCYSRCQPGYSRQGTFDCQQNCKPGWRDDGLFCRLAEYGRGAGYPWRFGDPLNDSGMFRRCEAAQGRGNCEKYGAIVYPKCRNGYRPFGCCICRPPIPNCRNEGYNSPGLGLSCPVKIDFGDPTPLVCAEGLERSGALCYPPCRAGFKGIAPVCWQVCDQGRVDCGVGCARDSTTCALATVDMVLAPLIVAANIATFGLTAAPANAARTVLVGTKTVAYSSKVGFAMLKLASKLQTISIPNVAKGATLVTRAKEVFLGTPIKVAKATLKVGYLMYSAYSTYSYVFAQNFAAMTSPEINSKLDQELEPEDALYIKGLWASLKFDEIQAAEGWNIGQSVLAAASLIDISGVTGVVSAYANPKCLDVVSFPNLVSLNSPSNLQVKVNSPPNAVCEDIEITADPESGCEGTVPADFVGARSTDPDDDLLTYSLSGGPFTVEGSPHTVTLTVTDRDSASDTCSAKITVTDPTEAVVVCPTAISQGTDPGTCSSVVAYADPVVIDNCNNRSTLALTSGLMPSSAFPLGETHNVYEVTTFPGGAVNFCSFNVNIHDVEAPKISCNGLSATLNTEPGHCTASYSYVEPVATDNCENDFDPEEFEAGVYVVQTAGSIQAQGQPFPLGKTTNAYEASDNEGNIAQCSFDVVVVDEELPSISCPESIVIAAIEFCDKAFVEYTDPDSSDNCSVDNVVLTNGQESGTYFPLGVTTVTWTVTDGSGNQNSCSFDVSVVEDLDEDGTRDCEDNCPTTYNPDQSDADEDGIGDACDEFMCDNCWPGTSGPCRQSNSVCMGLSHGNCPVGTRPCQTDPLPPCSMCYPGTHGPCQQLNGVCWQKLSSGECPTATTECRPQ